VVQTSWKSKKKKIHLFSSFFNLAKSPTQGHAGVSNTDSSNTQQLNENSWNELKGMGVFRSGGMLKSS